VESAPPAIEVRDLECRYGARTVLKGVSFIVREKEIFFVMGGNGSGKSTLLKHLLGLMVPARGSVAYFGKPFDFENPLGQRDLLKRFGVLFQTSALWSSMSLAENVELPLVEHTRLGRRERREIVALKLAQVGLTGNEHKYPAELSGGMKKRAGLARALALDPSIVFFDEPSAGLDPANAKGLDDLILETRDNMATTMVIVSHDLASIFEIGDRMIFLDGEAKGIIAEGPPEKVAETAKDPRVRKLLTRGREGKAVAP